MNESVIKKHILIIEDSVEQVLILKKLLELNDFIVDTASLGKEGLIKSKNLPDMILLDRSLPDIDGMDICQYIRQDHALKHIPIIFLTGHDTVDDIVDGLYIGADDYVTKPFDIKEVVARIKAVLRRKESCVETYDNIEAKIKELSDIIKQEKITPFYQPIFYLSSKKRIGHEVLSRAAVNGIFNDSRNLFKTSLDHGSYYELETLCWKKAASNRKLSLKNGRLFLNCLQAFIMNVKMDYYFFSEIGIEPNNLVIEITDIGLIPDLDLLIKKIDQLRSLGVSLSIDNFGNGFFGLDPIIKIRPDFLKIKMPMFRHIEYSSFKNILLKTTVDKCRKGSIMTIAEGVESHEELNLIRELDFDGAQGNLLGVPNRVIRPGNQ